MTDSGGHFFHYAKFVTAASAIDERCRFQFSPHEHFALQHFADFIGDNGSKANARFRESPASKRRRTLQPSPRMDVQIFDSVFRNALFLPVLQELFQRGALELFGCLLRYR